MIKEAIVLAGGKGTRLQSVVSDVPKPMAAVNGKPFLAYLLEDLSSQGLESVILAVGYKREVIMDYFGDNYQGMEVRYSVEEEALGTGGAIRLACKLCEHERVAAINGDTFFRVDLQKLSEFHSTHQAKLSIALKSMMDFDRYGTVILDENGRIIGFEEKSYKVQGLINGGIYVFDKRILTDTDFPEKFSFEKEILESRYQEWPFYGLSFDTYFIDIGIPKDYEQSQHDLAAL